MSRRMAVIVALVSAPYFYLIYRFLYCDTCVLTGNDWLYALGLALALPFILAAFAFGGLVGGVRTARGGLQERRAGQTVRGAASTWISLAIFIPAALAAYAIYNLFLSEPEPGRDRLGRICEENPGGGSGTCRPDPERKTDLLDRLNAQRREDAAN
ncbi:hypothetical protein K3172_14840 [Qipengyuania sp. 6B39]|uniref:hypothetical protein n=1 Tax=Qipengyuania proteolytica TaxID=2867239 RepID=UPI001C89418B|nr:hypothetical protein [Qipengyuania proteolytica]MBX7497133.1 hypothetical protein [Qipengyuania proteolytica]